MTGTSEGAKRAEEYRGGADATRKPGNEPEKKREASPNPHERPGHGETSRTGRESGTREGNKEEAEEEK